jgi:hypothetical protein
MGRKGQDLRLFQKVVTKVSSGWCMDTRLWALKKVALSLQTRSIHSPGRLLGVQILRPHNRPIELETHGGEPLRVLTSPPYISHMLTFETLCSDKHMV